jgi:hypothetical protein
MVLLTSLWLPILLAAVAVFVLSSVIHMVLPYHWNDLKKLPQEEAALDALRDLNIPAGDYQLPKPNSPKDMSSPAFVEKLRRGPLVLMTIAPGASPGMMKNLVKWFVYLIVVGFCCAYLASRVLKPGAPYLAVFRVAGFVGFMAYALALPQASIWYRRRWSATLKTMLDGLLYALVTAGIFGWLWPR